MTIKQTIAQIQEILAYKLVTVSEQPITLGDVLFIPVLVFIGLLLTKWLTSFVHKRLSAKKHGS